MLFKLKFFLLILVAGIFSLKGFSRNTKRPNILWIVSEDMSQDQACYGNKLVKTPVIDKLANEGMRFKNMYTTAGVCAPSRSALATGMYQTTLGAIHMSYPEELMPVLPEGIKTIEHILKENGYQTLGIGKDHYLFRLETSSFELNKTEDLIAGKPFFAKVNSTFTHREFKRDPSNPIGQELIELPPYYPNSKLIREDWAAYLENIQLLDKDVKEILDNFNRLGLLDNTIIFFFSDHGRPFLKAKYWTYDSGLRIPFVVYIPDEIADIEGYRKGSVNEQMLSAIDISATTLALAGIQKPEYMQGRVFLGEQTEPEREYVFAAIDRISGTWFKTRAVRNNKFKYIKNFNNGRSILECTTEYGKAKYTDYNVIYILDNFNKLAGAEKNLVTPLPLEELYDLENDPHEINNLAYQKEFQDMRKKMESVLTHWIIESEDKGFVPDTPEIQEHFINVRISSKEKHAGERLKRYIHVNEGLKKEGKL